MKIGVLGWDYGAEDVDAPVLATVGRQRGHDMYLFTLDDVSCAPTPNGFDVMVGDQAAASFDAIISRANLYSGRWQDRVERLSLLGSLPDVRMFDPVDVWLSTYSKLQTAQRLARAGLPVPPVRSATVASDVKAALDEWGDIVVKPSLECAGAGVERVVRFADDEARIEELLRTYRTLICQPFYPTQWGEYRVTVAGDELPLSFVKYPAVGQWMCRTPLGASFERVDLPADLAALALRATRLMGLTLAGLDILPTGDGYVILEVNPIPGNLDILGKASQRQVHDAVYAWVESHMSEPDPGQGG
jgi:ribosomal protein S6--L-glutamate ligase